MNDFDDDTEYTYDVPDHLSKLTCPTPSLVPVVMLTKEKYDEMVKRIAELETQQWQPVEYDDVISDNDMTIQVRVVIDKSRNDPRVHLHIRRRMGSEWRHVGLATVAEGYAIHKQGPKGARESADDEADRYYRGFNAGVEFAMTAQTKVLEERIAELEDRIYKADVAAAGEVPVLMATNAHLAMEVDLYKAEAAEGERLNQARVAVLKSEIELVNRLALAKIVELEQQLADAKGDADYWHKMYLGVETNDE